MNRAMAHVVIEYNEESKIHQLINSSLNFITGSMGTTELRFPRRS